MGRAVGVGQVYLEAVKDARGRWLDGGKAYRLTVPKAVPAAASVPPADADVGEKGR